MRRVAGVLDETAAALTAAGIDEPRRRARRLLAAALGVAEAAIFADPERTLSPVEAARAGMMLRRAAAHEPLSRIIGKRNPTGCASAILEPMIRMQSLFCMSS